jgi:hypothetical protein
MVDQILTEARKLGCTRVCASLPTTSTTSLDVLGEFLFAPGNAMSIMRCFLDRAPEDYDTQIVDLTTNDEDMTLLPFENPLIMQALLETLLSPWKLSYRVSTGVEKDGFIDLYLSNKLRQQAWIFPFLTPDLAVQHEHLSATAAYLYDIGIRDILAEVESGDYWQSPFKKLGFERVTTWFEVFFDINY